MDLVTRNVVFVSAGASCKSHRRKKAAVRCSRAKYPFQMWWVCVESGGRLTSATIAKKNDNFFIKTFNISFKILENNNCLPLTCPLELILSALASAKPEMARRRSNNFWSLEVRKSFLCAYYFQNFSHTFWTFLTRPFFLDDPGLLLEKPKQYLIFCQNLGYYIEQKY